MFEVKVLSRVQVTDPKFEGSGIVVYMMGEWMILRDDSNEYHRGIPLSSVTGVEPQDTSREKVLRAFEEVTFYQDETRTMASGEVPGNINYYRPDGEGIVSFKLPGVGENKEFWFVTSFNQRDQIEIPPSNNPKDIEIRHLRPFEIKSEIYADEVIVGRDREKETRALYDRLIVLLDSLVVGSIRPFKDSRRLCLEHVEAYLGSTPTWVFDGDEILDTLPDIPGRYLCGSKGTGRINRLAGTDKLSIYVDSRFSVVVKVVPND